MEAYKKLNNNSGVTHYEIGDTSIKILFNNGSRYLYTNEVTGKQHVDKMKVLARKGAGLSTYISQHVKEKYAVKLK